MDLFCLYDYVTEKTYSMFDEVTQLHYLIYRQNLIELKAKLESMENVNLMDKLLSVLIGCDVRRFC
jgi:hypothetical protein